MVSEIFRAVLATAREQLLLDYDKTTGFLHSGIKGDERAEALSHFLSSRLPPAFGVTTGEIIDRRDQRSGQLDLIVYDKTCTQPILAGAKHTLYPCEAVYAVIEVKSILTKEECRRCLSAAKKVRALKPFGNSFVDARTMGAPARSEGHRCMYVVFAYATDLKEADWLTREFERMTEVGRELQVPTSTIDRLLVLDRGLVNFVREQGKAVGDEPATLFTEFFLHLVNFLERERARRPRLSWQDYALERSKGWKTLGNH
ncbi:DUF6602 domain-containing protein [Vitreimonas sp.]|uniref:DUF6602 domain-containing protein n=1 Tax=Vitreimonas sp. TaxID=3069702 RepID=UPI002ED89968